MKTKTEGRQEASARNEIKKLIRQAEALEKLAKIAERLGGK